MANTIDATGLPLVNSQTNQIENVPFDDAHGALTSGSHNLQAGTTVNVVDPDGQLISLPSEQIPDALQSGYQIPSSANINEYNNQQVYGTGIGNELAAAAAGAARTATFGGSDVVLTKSGLVAPNTLQQQAQRNPVSSFVGSMGGAAGMLAIPGIGEAAAAEEAIGAARAAGLSSDAIAAAGVDASKAFRLGDLANPVQTMAKVGAGITDAAAPIAERIAASLANPQTSPIVAKILSGIGEVGAKTLGSAVEASAYGLGQSVSENILGDADLNAENLMHNVGYAALFGGGIGATLGIGGGIYKGLFEKEVANAASKDLIIENSANQPTRQSLEPLGAEYNYKPLDVTKSTEGKIFYHGTNAQGPAALDIASPTYASNVNNLYGEGQYLTDNPAVAQTYAGSTGTVLSGKLKNLNLLDIDKPLPENVRQIFNDIMPDDEKLGKGILGRDAYSFLKDAFEEQGLTTGDVVDQYQGLNKELADLGYDGIKHEGGNVVGGEGKHNVIILHDDIYKTNTGGLKNKIIPQHSIPPVNAPQSLDEMQQIIKNARELGVTEELPSRARALEIQDILAGEKGFYPIHGIQLESLESQKLRDTLKSVLEDPSNETGELINNYQSIQKTGAVNEVIPKLINDLAPDYKATADKLESGENTIKTIKDIIKTEKDRLAPDFEQFDKIAKGVKLDPAEVLQAIHESVPEATQFISKDPEGYFISKYKDKMPIQEQTHDEIKRVLDALNDPEGITAADLRTLRGKMNDRISFETPGTVKREVGSLSSKMMDMIQQKVEQNAPKLEVKEGLNHQIDPVENVRQTFRDYHINVNKQKEAERILGGSLSENAPGRLQIKPAEVQKRVFGNTVDTKIMKDILGPQKFKELLADYMSSKVADNTDNIKMGLSSTKFANFLKNEGGGKGHVLEEAFSQNPDTLKKLRAVTDMVKLFPDAPLLNNSQSVKSAILNKMSLLRGIISGDMTAIPGKILGAIGEKFEGYKQRSYFDKILRGSANGNTEEQLAQKQRMYGAYSKIERMGQTTTNIIKTGANALFKSEGLKGPVSQQLIPHEEQLKKYDKLSQHLIVMNGNTDKMANAIGAAIQPISEIAPNIAGGISKTVTAATQFLNSKLPAQNQPSLLTPAYKPSKSELAKFNRYIQIVENPLHVMKQLKNGDLTTESLETLQAVYPKLLSQMQQAVSEKLTPKNVEKMTYQAKIMASAFLGQDLSNSLSQPSIMSAQIQSAPQGPPGGQNAPRPKNRVGPSQGGLKHLDRATANMTPMQQSLARTER